MPREVSNALSLLLNAARIDPVLMDAARKVDRYIHDVQLAAIFSAAGVEGPGVVALVRGDDAGVTIKRVEVAGQGWCPVHGDGSCPEDYMLMRDGRVAAGYRDHWDDSMRCGKRVPLYRLVDGEDS
jgi:hypothetical protein